jgi:hypothetical protein
MAHRTNLVVATLSSLRLVSKVESLLVGMYNYFAHNLKTTFGVLQIYQNFGSKGNKLLKKKKTWWISMLSPCKRIFAKYKLLVVKMV